MGLEVWVSSAREADWTDLVLVATEQLHLKILKAKLVELVHQKYFVDTLLSSAIFARFLKIWQRDPNWFDEEHSERLSL